MGGDGENVFRLAVLASGNGSNLQAIIDRVHGRDGIEVVAVISDKPGCNALARAGRAGIATATFPAAEYANREQRDLAMVRHVEDADVDLVVLAGYMQLLSPAFVRAFERRIVNVHPALLPAFPGLHAIEQALAAGVDQTGVTVHYVDEGVDTGPVIDQRSVPIELGDTIETLAPRIHAVEHELLPSVIRRLAVERGVPAR